MIIKDNLGGIISSINNSSPTNKVKKESIGKVCGVITTENTPTPKLFQENGGWNGLGTVFYLDFDQSKNTDIQNVKLEDCKVAKPFSSNIQDYPLIGELIYIIDAPAPSSQINNSSSQKYYTGVINLWNNVQQNSPTTDKLGKTFLENSDVRNLIYFEGDRIYQGRKGNGIRFGSTVKEKSNINEWSDVGNNGDPITILVNGYTTTQTSSISPNVEEINKEKSSIYLTTTQRIPLIPSTDFKNPRINTILPRDYSSSQIIFNSDRITLNSKKDEILLFAKTNIEFNSNNIININARNIAHINSPIVLLGINKDDRYPIEPVMLGNKTQDLLLEMCGALSTLASFLSTTTVPTSDGVVSVTNCNLAGEQLYNDVESLIDKLKGILSQKVYTS